MKRYRMKGEHGRRFLAVLLSFALILSSTGFTVFAEVLQDTPAGFEELIGDGDAFTSQEVLSEDTLSLGLEDTMPEEDYILKDDAAQTGEVLPDALPEELPDDGNMEVPSAGAGEQAVTVTTWEQLKTAVESGYSVTLAGNITAAQNDSLTVPQNSTITLNLARYTLTGQNPSGALITVKNADLILEGTGGYITNVYNEGIHVDFDASFTMNGGTIQGCTNGVSVIDGTVTLNGGSIASNNANGISLLGGTLILNGGSVKSNREEDVYCDSSDFSLSGMADVENIYLDYTTIGITSPLGSRSYRIGMSNAGVFTYGLSGNGTAANFVSKDENYTVLLNGEGEAALAAPDAVVNYVERSWSGGEVVSQSRTVFENWSYFPASKEISGGWYYLNSDVTVNDRVKFTGDAHLILGDGHTLDVKGLYIPEGSTLTVYGQSEDTGKIYSHPSGGAAIGGYDGKNNGNIELHGGVIEANGASHCAGIGSNDAQTGGFITIYGGTVTAKGGGQGAGIGGGRNCGGGSVTIYGGDVTATGGSDGAGIGGGQNGDGGTVKIYGGTVNATGTDSSAGIGGGDPSGSQETNAVVEIYGGDVTATGGSQGAGIGGGEYGHATVMIAGGSVTATGGSDGGAGIGSGVDGTASTISITGGVVNAKGLSNGVGLGNGNTVSIKGTSKITLDYTDATMDTIQVTFSSYSGVLTMLQPFKNDTERYEKDRTYTNWDPLWGKTLVAWDKMDWPEVQEMINEAHGGSVTITLLNDVKAGESDGPLVIDADTTVTLDLNGYKLDRNYNSTDVYSEVITVYGNLTIEDSSGEDTGSITGCKRGTGVRVRGGNLVLNSGTIKENKNPRQGENESGNGSGGGVDVAAYQVEGADTKYGSFTMNGGRITGNQASGGGGVKVSAGCTFTMNGGEIASNTADVGGGVLTINGTFTMNGGVIQSNIAKGEAWDDSSTEKVGGGGVAVLGYTSAVFNLNDGAIQYNGSFGTGGGVANMGGQINMTGGSISNNDTSDLYGAGVDILGGTFRMSGGEITGNKANPTEAQLETGLFGGGVFVRTGTHFEISGAPVIKDNVIGVVSYEGTMDVDVLLPEEAWIDVKGPLTSGADVSVYPGIPGMQVTKGLAQYGGSDPLQYIKCDTGADDSPLAIALNTAGEAVIGAAAAITYKPGSGSGIDVVENVVQEMDGYILRENPFTAPDGQIFYNWEIDGSAYYPGEPFVPKGDTAVNAVWGSSQYFTVTFDKGREDASGVMSEAKVDKGSGTADYVLPACRFTAPEGYVFAGWKVGEKTEISSAGTEITLTDSVTLTASWILLENVVILDSNCGAGIVEIIKNKGESYELPECIFTHPEGKQFGGWIVDDGEELYFPGDTITVTGNTVKAYWGSEWAALQIELSKAENNSTVTLTTDYVADDTDMALQIPSGKTLTLDLNGHTIDRNDPDWEDWDSAIKVFGSLTIKDSSADGTGTITGGSDCGIAVGRDGYPGHLTLISGTITRNIGMGVSVSAGDFTMQGGTIRDNEDSGVYVSFSKFFMTGGKIVNNSALHGGGIYLSHSEGHMNGGTISGNDRSGVYVSFSKFFMTDGKIVNNSAVYGGGVYLVGSEGQMYGGEISGNKAKQDGGGLSLNDTDFTISGGVISGNTAIHHGGGVDIENTIDFTRLSMTGGEITGNTAGVGGGIYLFGDVGAIEGYELEVEISGGTITGNKVENPKANGDTFGGGIYQDISGKIKLSGTPVITGNTTQDGLADNIVLRSDVLYITDTLTEDAIVGVSVLEDNTAAVKEDGTIVFTSGLSGKGMADNFTSDSNIYVVGLNGDGEASLLQDKYLVTFDSDGGSKVASQTIDMDGKAAVKPDDPVREGYVFTGWYLVTDGAVADTTFDFDTLIEENITLKAGWITSWQDLQQRINNAAIGEVITLTTDVYPGPNDTRYIFLKNNTEITLDLAGNTLDRRMETAQADGMVIFNNGDLTIMDSVGGGKITGGFNSSKGGGIYNSKTLTINGGEISGNKTNDCGGGISNSGDLTINSGVISGNIARNGGGGIYCDQYHFFMNGGSITGNRVEGGNAADYRGGAGVLNKWNDKNHSGYMYMTGGTISENYSQGSGSGICNEESAVLNLSGGSIIDNTFDQDADGQSVAGGIWQKGILNVSGNPVVKGNHQKDVTDREDNIRLQTGGTISVNGKLEADAELGVSLSSDDETGKFTTSYGSKNPDLAPSEVFTSDAGRSVVLEDGEAAMVLPEVIIKSMNVDFQGKIQLQFTFTFPEDLLADEGAYLTFEKAGTTTEKLISEGTASGNDTKFKIFVPAPEYADDVTVMVYDGEGTQRALKSSKGEDFTENGFAYSVQKYAQKMSESASTEEMRRLAKALDDYGTAAQIYFAYGDYSELMVDSAVTDVTPEDLAPYKLTSDGAKPAGVTGAGIQVWFETDNTLRINFKTDGSRKLADYTFLLDGVETKPRKSGKTASIQVANIGAPNLDIVHTFAVSDGTDTYTITANALSYAYLLAGHSDPVRQNLGKALYLYNQAAKAKFGS